MLAVTFNAASPLPVAIRPLSGFSDMVRHDLPDLLSADSLRLLTKWVEGALPDCASGQLSDPVALLDLRMGFSALSYMAGRKGLYYADFDALPLTRKLKALIRVATAEDAPAYGVTYADMVLSNPAGDMRGFACGVTGLVERACYTHYGALERQISVIADTALGRNPVGLSMALEGLQMVLAHIDRDLAPMTAEESMIVASFMEARPYTEHQTLAAAFAARREQAESLLVDGTPRVENRSVMKKYLPF